MFLRLVATLLLPAVAFAQTTARAIHDSAIIIDTHADTPQRLLGENFDLASDTPTSKGHLDLNKARAGNLGAEFFSIWVDPGSTKPEDYTRAALDQIDAVLQQVKAHPDRMVLATTAADIVSARTGQRKRFAALMGVEGGHAIQNDIRVLRNFYRLGVRYMTLTWSNTNEWADSSGDINNDKVKHHNGLTDFGRQVVAEMNRLGMLVDISHVSDKTFWDTLEVAKAPVIASHSSARALSNHPRNMTDEMLRAVAKTGGVVNVNFYPAFVDDKFRQAADAQEKERDAAVAAYRQKLRAEGKPDDYAHYIAIEKEWYAKLPRPPLKALIDQIDHVAKVAGIDHVGLGSDFDGVPCLPAGIDSVADLPKITQALVARGYTRAQIHKVLGGNMLRVMRAAERAAKTGSQRSAIAGD